MPLRTCNICAAAAISHTAETWRSHDNAVAANRDARSKAHASDHARRYEFALKDPRFSSTYEDICATRSESESVVVRRADDDSCAVRGDN